MTKFLNNADVKGYVAQTAVTSSLLKTDANGKLVAAVAGTDYNAPNVSAVAGTLIREVRNTTGATLVKGTVVYISGATGNKATVSKAIATGDSTSAQTFGLCQTDIANNSNGYVVCVGDITGLDTSAFTEGVQLYLSSTTAGTYTSTKQLAPAHLVYVGVVTRSHPTLGQIEVKIQNGYELDEIHDVSISSLANNHTLVWESATSLWKNKTIAAALGYTPANGANYLPLVGGTLTGDLTLSGTNPRLYFTDTDNNPDYFISNTDGTFTVYDVTNSVGRFKIYTTGNSEFTSNLAVNGGTVNTTTYTSSEARLADGSVHLMKTSAAGIFEAIRAMNLDTTAGTTVRLVAAATSDPFNNTNGGKVFIDAVRTSTNMDLVFSLNDVAGAAPVERVRFSGSGNVTAVSFIKSGGTSAQFLKADGSVDSSTYLTSYTETSTLATVTGRGASTSTNITLTGAGNTFNGHHYFSPYDANGNHYPHYNPGSNSNGSKLNLRMFDNAGNAIVFHLNGSSKAIEWNGNSILHAGNYSSYALPLTGGTLTGSITATGLTINTGGAGTWGPFVVTSTALWGDGTTQYVTIGAGGAAGIMMFNPHVVWNASNSTAAIRIGRSGGVSTGAYYEIGTGASDNFFIAKNSLANGAQFNINSSGNATFSGTVTASSFTGNLTGSADSVGGIGVSRIVYGENSTATTSITNSTLDGALKSGFYTVGSGGIPNATSVNFVLHTAYYGIGNLAGFDLACNDSTTSAFYLRPATGAGKGSWQTVITSSNIGSQSVNYASTAGTASSANAVAWSNVSGKPGSLSGYGIGDAVTAYYGTDINPNTQVGNYTTMTTQSGISGWTHVLSMAWQPSTVANWVSQIGFGAQAGDGAYYRTTSGSINGLGWKRLIDSGNIGSQSVNYATSAGSASSAGYSSSTGAVVHNSGRTDSAWYNVGWFASSPSPAYSADGVQIQSSTNSLRAQNLRANGNLFAGASLVGMGNNDTSFQTINFGISGADYKHKYILLAKVPTYGAVTVNCSINGRITSARVNNLDMNVDQEIMLSMGYGNTVSYNTEAKSNSRYSLVVYNYGGTNYYALYMYTAPNYYQGTFTGLITNVGGWLDGNFLVVVELNSANHSAASYGTHDSTIMNNVVLHAGNASYAYNMNQGVRTDSTPTFTDVYVNSWFRNNANNTGLYSTANNVHFYSTSDGLWNMGFGSRGNGGLILRYDHQSTIKGYLYWDGSGFGLLNNSGDWAIRTNYGGSFTGGTLYGSWVVTTATSGVTMTLGPVENSRTYNDTDRHGLVINASYYPHLDLNCLNNGGNTTHGAVISMTGVKTGGGFRRWGMGIANVDPGYFSIGWYDNDSNPHYGVGHSWGNGGRFIIDTAGNIWCTGDITAYGAQSDARLKNIKGKVDNALDGVLQLNGYRFDWKERDVKITTFVEDIGVVAQEVAEVFPELARVGEDGWMSVRYQGLTAVLIEAVKEQQKQIEELKSIINDFTK